MRQSAKFLLLVVLGFMASVGLRGVMTTHALEDYVIGEDVDFANSQGQGTIHTELQENGSIKTTFNTTNPSSVRMYHAAGGEEQYRVDLRDFTFNYTIDNMEINASYKIAFLKTWDDFPLDQWGTGLGFLMQNDNGGAYNVLPYLYTSGTGETQLSDKNYFLVYDNATRPSHLGKSITFKSVEQGDDLLITMAFDEVSDAPVTYGNLFPKSYFTDRGMDITQVLFMFGINDNSGLDFELTINDITDTNKVAYNNTYGDAAKLLFQNVNAIDALNPDISVEGIHAFYNLRKDVTATANLRKSDRYLKTQALDKITSLETTYSNAVVTEKDSLFGMYDEAFQVTEENLDKANSTLLVYNATKSALNDTELDERMALLLAKIVALDYQEEITALETTITEFLTLYPSVTADNYVQATVDYQEVLDEFNAFDEDIRQFVTNGADLLAFNEKLNEGRDLYYSNEGTRWVSYDSNVHNARMTADENGTKIILMDSYGDVRVVYGEDTSEYVVSLEDFKLVFSVDALNDLGRFAFNLGESREMVPNASVGKQGISIVFRSTSSNNIDVALKDTSNDVGLTFGTPLDGWGKYGSITGTPLRGSLITMRFTKVGANYQLKFEVVDGEGFNVEVPARYFNDRNLDVNNLVLNITTGEGDNHNNGDHIELTIKEVSGKNEIAYNALVSDFVDSLESIEALQVKLNDNTITAAEISTYTSQLKALNLDDLRSYDLGVYQTRFDALDKTNYDQKIATFMETKLEALESNISESNYENMKEKIAEIEQFLDVLTEEQKVLISNQNKLNSTKSAVTAYEASLDPQDPQDPQDPEEPIKPKKSNNVWVYILVSGLIVTVGVGVTLFFIRKKRS